MTLTQLKPQSKLFSFPLSLAEANELVERWHRTHKSVACHRFSIGVMDADGVPHGAAIVNKPTNRHQDQVHSAEVIRLVSDGTPNVCSFLYAACTRVCDELGFRRIQTYIPGDASGVSLKALKSLGWKLVHVTNGAGDWRARKQRNRFTDANVFVLENPHKTLARKQLWAMELNLASPNIMPKLNDKPLRRVCVRLYDEDCAALESMAAASGEQFNLLLRAAVHSYVTHALDRVRKKIDAMEK